MIAMLFQALSAKLGIVTGRNLAEMCRDRFPRPVVWAMWVISEIAAMATHLAEFLGGRHRTYFKSDRVLRDPYQVAGQKRVLRITGTLYSWYCLRTLGTGAPHFVLV